MELDHLKSQILQIIPGQWCKVREGFFPQLSKNPKRAIWWNGDENSWNYFFKEIT